jgi:hypothetical protein
LYRTCCSTAGAASAPQCSPHPIPYSAAAVRGQMKTPPSSTDGSEGMAPVAANAAPTQHLSGSTEALLPPAARAQAAASKGGSSVEVEVMKVQLGSAETQMREAKAAAAEARQQLEAALADRAQAAAAAAAARKESERQAAAAAESGAAAAAKDQQCRELQSRWARRGPCLAWCPLAWTVKRSLPPPTACPCSSVIAAVCASTAWLDECHPVCSSRGGGRQPLGAATLLHTLCWRVCNQQQQQQQMWDTCSRHPGVPCRHVVLAAMKPRAAGGRGQA